MFGAHYCSRQTSTTTPPSDVGYHESGDRSGCSLAASRWSGTNQRRNTLTAQVLWWMGVALTLVAVGSALYRLVARRVSHDLRASAAIAVLIALATHAVLQAPAPRLDLWRGRAAQSLADQIEHVVNARHLDMVEINADPLSVLVSPTGELVDQLRHSGIDARTSDFPEAPLPAPLRVPEDTPHSVARFLVRSMATSPVTSEVASFRPDVGSARSELLAEIAARLDEQPLRRTPYSSINDEEFAHLSHDINNISDRQLASYTGNFESPAIDPTLRRCVDEFHARFTQSASVIDV